MSGLIGGIVLLFNERLRALRQDKDLTQEELSKVLRITRKTLSNYETAYREPNLDTIIKIAKHFDISIDYLLCKTDIPTPYPKKHK